MSEKPFKIGPPKPGPAPTDLVPSTPAKPDDDAAVNERQTDRAKGYGQNNPLPPAERQRVPFRV